MVTAPREKEVAAVLAAVAHWAAEQPDVRAVAVVGSWARGDARMHSDIDLVVLTDDPSPYVDGEAWVAEAVGQDAPVVRTVHWGEILIERRLRLRSGLEVEFGFAPATWAKTDPVDPGTAAVVRKGCRAVFDRELIVQRLTEAVTKSAG